MNDSKGKGINLYYWLNRNREVDFILESGKTVTAIEVKSGKKESTLEGMEEFCKAFDVKRQLLVGGQGISIDEFLTFLIGFYNFGEYKNILFICHKIIG